MVAFQAVEVVCGVVDSLVPFRTASDKSWAWRPGNEAVVYTS